MPALMLWLVSACGERGGIDVVLQRDSAGIRIVETKGETARQPIGWDVGALPDLQLGSAADEGPEQFDRIGLRYQGGGIGGLPDGGIVVADLGSAGLRFFDSEGRYTGKSGRPGDGPGEFRMPRLIPYVSSDSILIFDRRHRRFTLLSVDGSSYRSFPDNPISKALLIGEIVGASHAGIVRIGVSSAVNMNEGQHLTSTEVRWMSMDSMQDLVVSEFQIPYYMTHDFGYPHGLNVPFNVNPAAAIAHRGFFVTGGDGVDVREFDSMGQLTRIMRLSEPVRPVTADEIRAAIESEISGFTIPHDKVRAAYKRVDFPDRWPTFQTLKVDRVGLLWAELYRATRNDPSLWMVFDSSGVAQGTVQLPADLEVHDIGRDYVLGRWRDSLRVEYVRRYRLERNN